ncbi:MAG: hypothetical protein RLZZ337_1896 [Bacteroidota bacterium]
MTPQQIEIELKKRWAIPYNWGKKQDDSWDKDTNFIYSISTFSALEAEIEQRFGGLENYTGLRNYAWNRWYNFHSAQAIEAIFTSHPKVTDVQNGRDREKDFYIDGIPFDHKTSVFPRQYGKSISEAVNNPKDLAKWLYINQSKEQRFHIKNRLFVVLHNSQGEHWKLKAEILLLNGLICKYLDSFKQDKLITLTHKNGSLLTDVLYATK